MFARFADNSMAREESDREDLMREATALRRRIELQIPGLAETVIAGFRAEGRLSIYFGPDPVYQFDEQGGLRRAFVAGRLYRSEGNTLAKLTRVRTPQQTELQREDLDPESLRTFLDRMRSVLRELLSALRKSAAQTVQQVPPGDERIAPDLAAALDRILARTNALAPGIR
jgi:hypothetical protein